MKTFQQDKSGKFDKVSWNTQIEKLKPFDEDLFHKMKQIGDTCFAEGIIFFLFNNNYYTLSYS